MASVIAIIRYALLETFFCISILAKTYIVMKIMYDSTKVNANALRIEMFYCGLIAKER